MTMTLENQKKLLEIALEMKATGIPEVFINSVVDFARQEPGACELMSLWAEAPTQQDKDNVIADLAEHLEENKEQRALINREHSRPLKRAKVSFDSLEKIATNVLNFKAILRNKIEQRGISISDLARLMDVPQPSLSRFFSSASMPRKTTLYKIANAADLREDDISEWVH